MHVPDMMSTPISRLMVKIKREDLKGSVVPTGSHKTNTVTLLCTGYKNQAGYRGSEGSGIVRDESSFFVIFS